MNAKKLVALTLVLAMLLTPMGASAAVVTNVKSYATEMMKAVGSQQLLVIKVGKKRSDGAWDARAYVYKRQGKKTVLKQDFKVLVGKRVRWSREDIYFVSHGKKPTTLSYYSSDFAKPNMCKVTYLMGADDLTISSYVQYKEANKNFKYPKKWKTDKTGVRNASSIAMSEACAKYIFSLGRIPLIFV